MCVRQITQKWASEEGQSNGYNNFKSRNTTHNLQQNLLTAQQNGYVFANMIGKLCVLMSWNVKWNEQSDPIFEIKKDVKCTHMSIFWSNYEQLNVYFH